MRQPLLTSQSPTWTSAMTPSSRPSSAKGLRRRQSAKHLPPRYSYYYDASFAREWTTTVAVVGWKLAQPDKPRLACVAEELALNALIREAVTHLEMRDLRRPHHGRRRCRAVVRPRRRRRQRSRPARLPAPRRRASAARPLNPEAEQADPTRLIRAATLCRPA